MRIFSLIAIVSTAIPVVTSAFATPVLTQKDAADRAHLEGYGLVSKAEQVPGAWDVWASKDGIPYEIKIDAHSGSVLAAAPADDND